MKKSIGAVAALAVVTGVALGCGSSGTSDTAAATSADTTTKQVSVGDPCSPVGATANGDTLWCSESGWVANEPEPKPEPVKLTVFPASDAYIQEPQAHLRGRTEPGAVVTITHRGARTRVRAAKDGRWSHTADVSVGANNFRVVARARGMEPTSRKVYVERELSEAERAEIARQREEDFRASAESIPYSQLIKDPEAFRGRRVRFYGQIFQIQQSGGSGFMLLSVTDLGYGIWDDNIWVNYDGSVSGADGDMITIYGTMTGSESYETQIGGETYVPRMRASYWDE